MTEKFIFEPVRHHHDYIEFRVSYQKNDCHWTVEGIAWVSNDVPQYYLRSQRLNFYNEENEPHKGSNLLNTNSSFKFEDPMLDQLTCTNIKKQFGTSIR